MKRGTKVRIEQLDDYMTRKEWDTFEGILTTDLERGNPLVLAGTKPYSANKQIQYLFRTTPIEMLYGLALGDTCDWRMVVTKNHTYRVTRL